MDDKKNTITCLFLGSGTSKALADIPIQQEFLAAVLEDGRHKWIDICEVTIGGMKISEWMRKVGDIEFCMSHIDEMGFGKRDNSNWRNYKKANINLRAATVKFLKDFKFNKIAIEFRKWLEKLGKESELVILTTNYDLVIEKLMKGHYYYPNIQLKPEKKEQATRLYKLHGSISWLEQREMLCMKRNKRLEPWDLKAAERPIQIKFSKNMINKIYNYYEYYIFKSQNKIYTPIFIPFFFQKHKWITGRWGQIFEKHWDNAKEILLGKNIKKFYFIGYNLPVADSYLFSWLMKIFESKKNMKGKIEIVCQPKPLERERLEVVLGDFVSSKNVHRNGLDNFLKIN